MNPIKIVTMVATALTFLAGLFFTGLLVSMPHWGGAFCTFVLCLFIGYFVYADVLYVKKYLSEKK